MSKSQVKKWDKLVTACDKSDKPVTAPPCDKLSTACAKGERKPGEKWTDGCCTSQLAEHSETGKSEDSTAQIAIESYSSESQSQKH